MDVKTLIFVIFLTNTINSLLLLLLIKNKVFTPSFEAIKLLLYSNLFILTGTALRLVLNNNPIEISIINLLLIIGSYYKIIAIKNTLKLKSKNFRNLNTSLLLLITISLNYFIFINNNYNIRSILFTLFLGLLYLIISIELKKSNIEKGIKKISYRVILFISFTFFIRLIIEMIFKKDSGFYNNDISNIIYTLNIYLSELILTPFIYIILHFENYIQLEKTKRNLIHASQEKSKILKIIAHDLRTPFNSIIGFSELNLNPTLPKEKKEILSKHINEVAKATLHQLENLLEYAKFNTDNETLKLEKIDIILLKEILNGQFKTLLEEKEINLNIHFPSNVFAFANRTMLLTVFTNLITNAKKYSTPKKEIKIYAEIQNNIIKFSITDQGIGMSQEKLIKLFTYEINQSTPGTFNEKGTGFGLNICKEILIRHGGQIWAESTEGIGSTFHFTIPLWQEESSNQE